MKKRFLVLGLSVMQIYCGGNIRQNPQLGEQMYERRQDSLSAVFKRASSQADSNLTEGFLKLSEIATDDVTYSVELSEVATAELHDLFIAQTDSWVQSFASLDSLKASEFRKYLAYSGVVDAIFPTDSISDRAEYQRLMFGKLDRIHGSQKVSSLVAYLKHLLARER